MNKTFINIEELQWNDVKSEIWQANSNLAQLLEQLNPKYSFFKARYHYGDKILNQGVLHLPTIDGGTIPLDSKLVPESIRKKLNYSYVPLALILSRSVEVFFETEDRVMPSKLFATGTTFGLWEVFDPLPSEFLRKVWNLSAGARSIFMLPKIADNIAHARLKRDYGITAYPPKTLLSQNKVFIDLARHSSKNTWCCEILFFCNKWLEEQEDNLSFVKLHRYWIREAWQQSFNCRNQMSYGVAWESFFKEVTRRNWKPRPYIINTIKHLMTIGEGIFPGFAPASNSEVAAPINQLQEAYIKSYMLKQYAPIIMQPHHLKDDDRPVYYSLYLPTLLEYAPQADNSRSLMTDMRELKMLIDVLLNSTITSEVNYEFFHCDHDQFSEIKNSCGMLEGDKNLMDYPKKYGKLNFADNSPFLRGCVRISRKK